MTYDCLVAAAVEIKTTNKCTDKAILALERQVQTVAAPAPNSFAYCYQFCFHLKALMVTDRMFALWITINPVNLHCLLVVQLTGLQNNNIEQSVISEFTCKTTIINSIAVAQFFHKTCNAIFNHLLAANTKKDDLFSAISTFFGSVETNDQRILHFHCLV